MSTRSWPNLPLTKAWAIQASKGKNEVKMSDFRGDFRSVALGVVLMSKTSLHGPKNMQKTVLECS